MAPDPFPSLPRLPPAFRLVALDAGSDTLAHACSLAADGADPGTVVWARRPDRLDGAVVLSPDRPLLLTRPVLLVAMLGLAGALGGVGPAQARVTFGWPDRVEVNGAVAGGARFAAPPAGDADGVPAWAVVGVAVDVLGDPGDDAPGRHPDRTTLREEGFEELDTGLLLEGFARHFLSWTGRWQEDGFVPVRDAWLWYFAQSAERRAAADLDETGALTLAERDGTRVRRDLARAALEPTWSLPERGPATAREGLPQ